MTKTKYKIIDLAVFTVLTVLLETLNLLMLQAFNEVFALSIMLPMTAIVMMRWRGFAIIPAALSGIVFAACSGGGDLYLIYSIGNCFALLSLFFVMHKPLQKKLMEKYIFTALYFISFYLFVAFGRSVVSAILDYDFFSSIQKFLLADTFNLVIGLIIMFVVRRQNGLFENQNDYLLRIQAEKEEETK